MKNLRSVTLLVLCLFSAGNVWAVDERSSTVGMPAKIEGLLLPAPKLEAKPQVDRDHPFVLRVVAVYPHGSQFRYDLEYYALEPGEYDVAAYLQPVGSVEPVELPAIKVKVNPILPPGHTKPNDLEQGRLPWLGGYRMWVTLATVAWLIAGYCIIFLGRKKSSNDAAVELTKPQTLADRLRPTVEAAVAGKLSQKELADLERTLFAFWRDRLQLNDVPAVESMRRLLTHSDAGQLLRQLEIWLHHPGPSKNVDVASLLAPYRAMPANALPEQPVEIATA